MAPLPAWPRRAATASSQSSRTCRPRSCGRELGGRNDPKARSIRKKQREFAAGIENMLENAMEAGDFRSVLPTRLVVMAILGMSNWSHRWIKGESYDAEAIAAVSCDLLFHGLAPSSASPYGTEGPRP